MVLILEIPALKINLESTQRKIFIFMLPDNKLEESSMKEWKKKFYGIDGW